MNKNMKYRVADPPDDYLSARYYIENTLECLGRFDLKGVVRWQEKVSHDHVLKDYIINIYLVWHEMFKNNITEQEIRSMTYEEKLTWKYLFGE